MQNKKSLILLSCLLSLLHSCATPPDVAVCTRLNSTQGYCVNTISNVEGIVDDTHLLNGKTWVDIVIESVYVPVDSWKEIKKFIINTCKKHNDCRKDISSWDRKLNSINP